MTIETITTKEAALRWSIPERRVRALCAQGRIPGAVKIAGRWHLPAHMARPDETEPLLPMPLMNTAFVAGHVSEAVAAVRDPHLREIAGAELQYFSGHAEAAALIAERHLDASDPALRLSACWIFAYANLTLGQVQRARVALTRVQQSLAAFDDTTPPPLWASGVFIVTAASVLLHLPLPEQMPHLMDAIKHLPPGLRQFALYVQAHHSYLKGDYAASLNTVDLALAYERALYPIPAIYLHLIAVMAAMSLKNPARAEKHLLTAWAIARPDDLIEAFGEHHGLLGGMLEAVIKPQWPDDFKRIIDITYQFSAGWRRVHNSDTGHDVADNLSTTEFAICMLAARDWSDREIADHLGLSVHTVKHHLSGAYNKLGIKGRKGLKDHMLL